MERSSEVWHTVPTRKCLKPLRLEGIWIGTTSWGGTGNSSTDSWNFYRPQSVEGQVLGERQPRSWCWTLASGEQVWQSPSWERQEPGTFPGGKSTFSTPKVENQVWRPGEAGGGGVVPQWLKGSPSPQNNQDAVTKHWGVLLGCRWRESWGVCSLGGRKAWELRWRLSLGLWLAQELNVALVPPAFSPT